MKIHTVQLNLELLDGGTAGMDATEYGAYVRLILTCYKTNDHTLPNDDYRLARISNCTPFVWRRIKSSLLEKFRVLKDPSGNEFLVHDKVFSEIIKYADKSSKNKANRLKALDSKQPLGQPNVNQKTTVVPPNADNLRTKNKELRIEEERTPISPLEAEMLFNQLWAIYPGHGKHGARSAGFKGSKSNAYEKFKTLLKTEKNYEQFTTTLCHAAGEYAEFLSKSDTPSRHLTTWLNGKAWKDDWSSTGGEPKRSGFDSNAAALAEGVRRTLRPDGSEGGIHGGIGVQTISPDEQRPGDVGEEQHPFGPKSGHRGG